MATLLLLLQSQTLPPPYPRDGTTKLLENDRVIVWDVSWLQQPYPVHRHLYDYFGVYYTNGNRIIVSDRGVRSQTSSVAWDTFFYSRGVTYSEEGASSDPLRGVFVEFKAPDALRTMATNASAPAFPDAPGKKVRESERVENWEYVPHVTFVPRGTLHNDEQTAGAARAYVFVLK